MRPMYGDGDERLYARPAASTRPATTVTITSQISMRAVGAPPATVACSSRPADAAPPTGRGAPDARDAALDDRAAPTGGDAGAYDRVLFEAFRVLRRSIAEERGVPPYLVFSDASLRDMARLRPRTRDELLEVKGVGEWKAETFGERFLLVIRQQPGAG